jgi:hypothetical protein
MYVNHPKETLKGDFPASQGRVIRSNPLRSVLGTVRWEAGQSTQIRLFSEQSDGFLELVSGSQRHSKLS